MSFQLSVSTQERERRHDASSRELEPWDLVPDHVPAGVAEKHPDAAAVVAGTRSRPTTIRVVDRGDRPRSHARAILAFVCLAALAAFVGNRETPQDRAAVPPTPPRRADDRRLASGRPLAVRSDGVRIPSLRHRVQPGCALLRPRWMRPAREAAVTPKVGDRIAVAAQKTAPARRGTVLDIAGTMWTVEWDDGRRSTFVPAPGSVTIEGAAHGTGAA